MADGQLGKGAGKRRLSAKEFLRQEKKRKKMNPARERENRENVVNDNISLGLLKKLGTSRVGSTRANTLSVASLASVDTSLGSSLRRSASAPLSRRNSSNSPDIAGGSSQHMFATFKPAKNNFEPESQDRSFQNNEDSMDAAENTVEDAKTVSQLDVLLRSITSFMPSAPGRAGGKSGSSIGDASLEWRDGDSIGLAEREAEDETAGAAKTLVPDAAYRPMGSCPVDYTLKQRVRFLSKAPFEWAKIASCVEASEAISAFHAPLPGEQVAPVVWGGMLRGNTGEKCSTSANFRKALMYAVHPAAELPPAFLGLRSALLKSEMLKKKATRNLSGSSLGNVDAKTSMKDALSNFFDSRQRDWEEAFSSLFGLFCRKKISHFYLNTSFTAMFVHHKQHKNGKGASIPRVVISPSTRGLRGALRKLSIPYTMPHDANNTDLQEETDDDVLRELKLLQDASEIAGSRQQTRMRRRTGKDVNGVNSTLYVTGEWAVQGVFDFLLNMRFSKMGIQPVELPVLLSGTPFKNSTTRSLEVTRNSTVRVEKGEFHALELSGPILPNVVPELVSLFRTTQKCKESATEKSKLEVDLHTKVETRSFNFNPGNVGSAGELGTGWIKKLYAKSGEAGTVCYYETQTE